jgi:hypothetical protein
MIELLGQDSKKAFFCRNQHQPGKPKTNPPSFSLFPSVQILFQPSVDLTIAVRSKSPTAAPLRDGGEEVGVE